MEVILLQKVTNLGAIGDRVKVKPGYGRNFLIPQGKAALATAKNVAALESRRAELEKAAADELAAAQQRAAAFEGFTLTLKAKAGNEGKLFGSITTPDIAQALAAQGIKVERSEIRLVSGAIRLTGEHHVRVHLHSDVTIDLPVTVVAED
jgi:large subunit ribosomal protein L9